MAFMLVSPREGGGIQALHPLHLSPRKLKIKDMILSLKKSIMESSLKAEGIYLIF